MHQREEKKEKKREHAVVVVVYARTRARLALRQLRFLSGSGRRQQRLVFESF
jgi:hypothetical protein